MTESNELNATSSRRVLTGWLILGVGLLFYLLTLRAGHRAGDFAMYIQHTVNMAEGRPYAESQYVQNPAALSVGTQSYPPGLPVLLLPIYLAVGLSVMPMKVLMVLLFMASIYVFWLMTRERMAVSFMAVMLFDVLFTPYLWSFKDNVESDFPFLLPLFLSLWIMGRVGLERRDRLRWIGLGVIMYAAIAIRPIGLVLPISLLLYDLIDRRRLVPSLRFWVPFAVLMVLMVVQKLVLPVQLGSYSDVFLQEVESPLILIKGMILNAKFYILACAGRILLTNGHGTVWADVLLIAFVGPFLFGLVTRVRERMEILDVFFVAYAGILLLWPFRQPNYLIPIIPHLSLYAFVGLERLTSRFAPRATTWAAAGAVAILAVTFGMNYATMNFRNVAEDVMSPASMAFYERVKADTPPDALILTRLPREVAFFTGRKATPPNLPELGRDAYSPEEVVVLFDYIEKTGVDLAATGPKGTQFHREILPLWNLAEETPDVFVPMFRNGEWRLYGVASGE